MKTNKTIALALAMIMSLSMLAGCNTDETTDTATDTDSTSPTVMADDAEVVVNIPTVAYASTTVDSGVTSTTTDSAEDAQIVFTFDGGQIGADAYAYGLSQSFYTLETEYYESLQTGEIAIEFDKVQNYEAAKEYAIEYLLQVVAIDLILAENNYEMPESLIETIDADILYAEETMGTETFDGTLALMGISREGFRNEQLRVYAFEECILDIYGKSDEELYASYESDYYKAQHILLSFAYDETGAVSEEARAETLALAQTVLDEVHAGEKTFEELMEEYNADTAEPISGYAFKDGYMLEEFEIAAKELAEGEISELVETEYGIHIIKAVPASIENFEANAENIEYIEYYISAEIAEEALYARMDAIKETLVETDLLATIDGTNYVDYYVVD